MAVSPPSSQGKGGSRRSMRCSAHRATRVLFINLTRKDYSCVQVTLLHIATVRSIVESLPDK